MEYNKQCLKTNIKNTANNLVLINENYNTKRVQEEIKYLELQGEDLTEIKELFEQGNIGVADRYLSDVKAKKINRKAQKQVLLMSASILLLVLLSPFITNFVIDKGLFFMITNTITVLIGLILIVGIKVLYELIRVGLFFKDGVNSAINSNWKHVIYSFGFLTTFILVAYKLINVLLLVSNNG